MDHSLQSEALFGILCSYEKNLPVCPVLSMAYMSIFCNIVVNRFGFQIKLFICTSFSCLCSCEYARIFFLIVRIVQLKKKSFLLRTRDLKSHHNLIPLWYCNYALACTLISVCHHSSSVRKSFSDVIFLLLTIDTYPEMAGRIYSLHH